MDNVFKALREKLGMTQHEAGLAIHKTQGAVSKIERGDPRWSLLEKLAAAKGKRLAILIEPAAHLPVSPGEEMETL